MNIDINNLTAKGGRSTKFSIGEKLKRGEFFLLFELALPRERGDSAFFESNIQVMEDAVATQNSMYAGLAITDNSNMGHIDQTEFLSLLSPGSIDSSLVFLSGRGATSELLQKRLDDMKRLKLRHIAVVTGDGQGDKLSRREKLVYTESVHMLNKFSTLYAEGDFVTGVVVNPFKYTPEEIYPQYYKLMKKIREGASFAVVQSGWDMLKLQELRWFLEMRDCHIPTIARLTVLTPESAEDIVAGRWPGVIISNDLKNIFRKEGNYGYSQFASAQWRRIQIMAAGAKLLGYSGLQIYGVERREHIESACSKIAEALDEFKNFEDWKEEYFNHLARAEMAPFPYKYYIFENLFKWPHPEGELKVREIAPVKFGFGEKIKLALSERLFEKAHRHVPEERYFSKKILADCRGCKYCRLPLLEYVCPETCPKGLSNGPCGGSFPGGECEFRKRKCIYNKVFRNAVFRKETNTLEERFIRPVE